VVEEEEEEEEEGTGGEVAVLVVPVGRDAEVAEVAEGAFDKRT
jgi:hypothetical protein